MLFSSHHRHCRPATDHGRRRPPATIVGVGYQPPMPVTFPVTFPATFLLAEHNSNRETNHVGFSSEPFAIGTCGNIEIGSWRLLHRFSESG
ncbi:hypothetical protein LINPERHAP1_LOCUS35191 [Linum perenne]